MFVDKYFSKSAIEQHMCAFIGQMFIMYHMHYVCVCEIWSIQSVDVVLSQN